VPAINVQWLFRLGAFSVRALLKTLILGVIFAEVKCHVVLMKYLKKLKIDLSVGNWGYNRSL
jgi:hypothetical protein